jgi:hypothetical protein
MDLFTCLLWYFCRYIEASSGEAITFGGDVSKEADVESMMKAVGIICLQTGIFIFSHHSLVKLDYYCLLNELGY